MTIRGGGHPKQAMVLKPVSRMGPPPRSFAADAHDCIMVRSLWTYRIQGCGAILRARWQAPLGPFCCPTKKITGARSKSAVTENAPYKGYPGGLRIVLFEMLWGRRWARWHHRRLKQLADGASHVRTQRLEQVPYFSGARQDDHCGHRDESIQLARCRHCSRHRASSTEEA